MGEDYGGGEKNYSMSPSSQPSPARGEGDIQTLLIFTKRKADE